MTSNHCSLFVFALLFVQPSGSQSPYMTTIFDWAPYSVCDLENPSDSEGNYGLIPSMTTRIFESLEWEEGVDYTYHCGTWGDSFVLMYTEPTALWFFTPILSSDIMKGGLTFVQVIFQNQTSTFFVFHSP
jgi:hypothetical protein